MIHLFSQAWQQNVQHRYQDNENFELSASYPIAEAFCKQLDLFTEFSLAGERYVWCWSPIARLRFNNEVFLLTCQLPSDSRTWPDPAPHERDYAVQVHSYKVHRAPDTEVSLRGDVELLLSYWGKLVAKALSYLKTPDDRLLIALYEPPILHVDGYWRFRAAFTTTNRSIGVDVDLAQGL